MQLAQYRDFTRQLTERAAADPLVLGLVALGSMAECRGRLPDAWSDHDFFVVAAEPERLRNETSWLPQPEAIAFWFRETPHGCRAIWDSGHLAEYAVFTPDELRLARVNDYRVVLDRERIVERMRAVADASAAESPSESHSTGVLLSELLVAAARARRGELVSARARLSNAVRLLVVLIDSGTADDSLDPLRRFERRHGELAASIEEAVRLDPLAASEALLRIAADRLRLDPRAVAAVRRLTRG